MKPTTRQHISSQHLSFQHWTSPQSKPAILYDLSHYSWQWIQIMLLPNKLYSQQSLRCSREVKNSAKNALNDTGSLSFQGHCTKQLLNQHFLPLMPQLLLPTSDPASFPPSACNIHLGERCHDETHILMLTRTLPWALFTTSVTYHQIKSASEGWK